MPATLKFLDLDDDNVISIGKNTVDDPGDREIIGNSQPRFQYGSTLSMSWAGIDFSIFFQGIGRRHWYPKPTLIAFWGSLCPCTLSKLDAPRLPHPVLDRGEP